MKGRKIYPREKEESSDGSEDILLKFIDVYDNFERTLNSCRETIQKNPRQKEKNASGIYPLEAMESVFQQFRNAISAIGVKEIKAQGEKFDPNKHEVIKFVNSKEPEATIVVELQKGYMFKDKVLRHSKVKISTGIDPSVKNMEQS